MGLNSSINTLLNFPSKRRSGLLFTTLGVILAGSTLAFLGLKNNWLTQSFTVTLKTDSSEGFNLGTSVSISGVEVGSLEKIQLLSDGNVKLTLKVQEKYRPWVSPSSKALLVPPPPLGKPSIRLTPTPGHSNTKVKVFSVKSIREEGLNELIGNIENTRQQLDQVLEASTKIASKDLPPMLLQLERTLDAAENTSRIINKEMPILLSELDATLKVFKQTGKSTEEATREASQTLNEIRPELKKSLDEFSNLIIKAKATVEQFNYLLEPMAPSN